MTTFSQGICISRTLIVKYFCCLQNPHPHLQKTFLQARRKKLEEGKPLDWASAEALAFGSLLLEGKKETRGREAAGLGFSRGLGIRLPAGK